VSENYLRRYTDLPALIYLLSKKKITLLDPQLWDDSNDSHFLAVYREKMKLKSILALCFTQASETYHHWRVYANGPSGICIRFNRSRLIKAVKNQPGLQSSSVTYLKLIEIRDRKLAIHELPFLKRYAFEHENEFRMIYESTTKHLTTLDIPIPLSCIDNVTLSPWAHKSQFSPIKALLRTISGCSGIKLVPSTLISNEEWKYLGETAT